MTATTAIPEAVLTGLAFNFGKRVFLCSGGTAAMMSTSLGESSKYVVCMVRSVGVTLFGA